jgi:hypothetical protein
MNIKTYAIMAATLVVDLDASRAKFEEELLAFDEKCATEKALRAENQEPIRLACEAVFEKNPTAKFNLPAFLSYAAAEVGYTHETHDMVREQINDYLHEATDLYAVVKGPKGGVKRVADIKAAEEAAAKAKADAKK